MEAQPRSLGLGDPSTVASLHAVDDRDASAQGGASLGRADLCRQARGWWLSFSQAGLRRALGKGPGRGARPLLLSSPRCAPAALPAHGGCQSGRAWGGRRGFGQAAGKGQRGNSPFCPWPRRGECPRAQRQERSSPLSALASSRKFSSAEGPRSLGAKPELCLKP